MSLEHRSKREIVDAYRVLQGQLAIAHQERAALAATLKEICDELRAAQQQAQAVRYDPAVICMPMTNSADAFRGDRDACENARGMLNRAVSYALGRLSVYCEDVER